MAAVRFLLVDLSEIQETPQDRVLRPEANFMVGFAVLVRDSGNRHQHCRS